jgi:Protein of unknown function (DUF3710)
VSLFRKKTVDETGIEAATSGPQDDDIVVPPGTDVTFDRLEGDAEVAPSRPGTTGPFDVADVEDDRLRLDFGSLRVPAVDGMEIRVDAGPDGRLTGVGLVVDGSVLQLQAFAAPRTEGIWDDVRAEIAQGLVEQGGSAEETSGRFGPELKAEVPVQWPDGRSGRERARFVGVDGPRWFLRGVISGAGAVDASRATTVEDMFAGVVVVRGSEAAPPREPLPLTMPEGAGLVPAEEPAE